MDTDSVEDDAADEHQLGVLELLQILPIVFAELPAATIGAIDLLAGSCSGENRRSRN